MDRWIDGRKITYISDSSMSSYCFEERVVVSRDAPLLLRFESDDGVSVIEGVGVVVLAVEGERVFDSVVELLLLLVVVGVD